MNDFAGVIAAAAEIEKFCHSNGWKFCFIGGLAVQRWGMPRFTQDVDLTLFTGIGDEHRFVDPLLKAFSGRIKNARQFAMQHRVLLARTASGIDIDLALGAFPFEEMTISRASIWNISELFSLTTCSPEDLIIHKAFAARERDWADIETILARQHGRLDFNWIRQQLPPLLELKDDVESMPKLEQMIATVEKRLQG